MEIQAPILAIIRDGLSVNDDLYECLFMAHEVLFVEMGVRSYQF